MTLTERQRQVAELAAKGYGYKEIGDALAVSHWTVRTHIIAIANRLGCTHHPLRCVRDWMQGKAA